jgi:tetratricopeptide (TPR) repeat protein
MRMATALEPTEAGWWSNLGYLYLNARHSWAAEREFDRSLAVKLTPQALAGRAQARLNQQELDGAAEDARASFEMKPNEIALTVLGDIAVQRDDDQATARSFWLDAYALGSRDNGLMERLKTVGVTDPANEVAKP